MHQSLNSASLSFVYINSGLSCISCNPLPAGFTGIDDPYEPPLNCEVGYCRLCTQTMLLGIKFFIRDQIPGVLVLLLCSALKLKFLFHIHRLKYNRMMGYALHHVRWQGKWHLTWMRKDFCNHSDFVFAFRFL